MRGEELGIEEGLASGGLFQRDERSSCLLLFRPRDRLHVDLILPLKLERALPDRRTNHTLFRSAQRSVVFSRTMSSLPLESRKGRERYGTLLVLHILFHIFVPRTNGLHHMKRAPVQYVSQRDESRPLSIVNRCAEIIWPGIATQSGTPPRLGGFELYPGGVVNLTVGADWQGRVWGRTNCSFNFDGSGPSTFEGVNGYGRSCSTGDCNGILDCQASVGFPIRPTRPRCAGRRYADPPQGTTPVTLAEFTLATASGQTFYDISLVDGYNIPMAIISLYPQSGNSTLTDIPPNLTNPICIGTAALLDFDGAPEDVTTLGTNLSYPIPLEESRSYDDIERWCPWDLQLNPPTKPQDGIYRYPDATIQRPLFNPCFSACAKYNKPPDCCTGRYNSPNICKPSQYSREAKKVCPDAYSFGMIRGGHGTEEVPPLTGFQRSTINHPRLSFPRVEDSR